MDQDDLWMGSDMTKIPFQIEPDDLCLYHWSPVERRKGIKREGFVPGKRSPFFDWRPPYTCFSPDPVMAWQLSGRNWANTTQWDLWMVFAYSLHDCPDPQAGHVEAITDTYVDTGNTYIKEYRVYYRVPKRFVHYIATRDTQAMP